MRACLLLLMVVGILLHETLDPFVLVFTVIVAMSLLGTGDSGA